MKWLSVSQCALGVAGLILVAVSSPATAEETDDCGDIITALKSRAEAVAKSEASTPAAICANKGHTLGIMESIRIVAEECYDEGQKRDDIIKDMMDKVKPIQDGMTATCK
jgi:hypothetical protein